MAKIEWVDSKKGWAITLDSIKDIVEGVYETHWPGAKPEMGEINHYANGRADMRDELINKIDEIEERINGLNSNSNG